MTQNPNPDPKLDALLDDALSAESIPGGVPSDLSGRIFAMTRSSLAASQRSVLARIGPMRWAAIAALLILAAGAAIWFNVAPAKTTSSPLLAQNGSATLIAEIEGFIHTLTNYNGPGESIDQDLAILALQVEPTAGSWDSPQLLEEGVEDPDFATSAPSGHPVF